MRDCSADRHDADRSALRREATPNIHGDLEHPCTWLGMLSTLVAAGSSQNPLGANLCRAECPRTGSVVLAAMQFEKELCVLFNTGGMFCKFFMIRNLFR